MKIARRVPSKLDPGVLFSIRHIDERVDYFCRDILTEWFDNAANQAFTVGLGVAYRKRPPWFFSIGANSDLLTPAPNNLINSSRIG